MHSCSELRLDATVLRVWSPVCSAASPSYQEIEKTKEQVEEEGGGLVTDLLQTSKQAAALRRRAGCVCRMLDFHTGGDGFYCFVSTIRAIFSKYFVQTLKLVTRPWRMTNQTADWRSFKRPCRNPANFLPFWIQHNHKKAHFFSFILSNNVVFLCSDKYWSCMKP